MCSGKETREREAETERACKSKALWYAFNITEALFEHTLDQMCFGCGCLCTLPMQTCIGRAQRQPNVLMLPFIHINMYTSPRNPVVLTLSNPAKCRRRNASGGLQCHQDP